MTTYECELGEHPLYLRPILLRRLYAICDPNDLIQSLLSKLPKSLLQRWPFHPSQLQHALAYDLVDGLHDDVSLWCHIIYIECHGDVVQLFFTVMTVTVWSGLNCFDGYAVVDSCCL